MSTPRTSSILGSLAISLSGCATHELVLSRALRPILADKEVCFPVTLFRARVQMHRLEVWTRVRRSDADYEPGFATEIGSAAVLCAALARSDLPFEHDWSLLTLEVTNEYGSQWRWRNTIGYAKVRISREKLIELRAGGAPASEYPRHWDVFVHKVGPPDFVPREWSSSETSSGS